MSRLFTFLGHRHEQVAMVDTTGGFAEAIKLTDNDIRKVLLRLRKNGVTVEMTLTPAEAEDFHTEILAALRWTREDPERTEPR